MENEKLRKIVHASLFAALICAATMVIHIPVPATGGYLNLGDAFILTAALLLGPVYGFAAGGIGSMLADILSGYPQYAVGTLLIKGASALVAALLWKVFSQKLQWRPVFATAVSGIIAEAVMVFGYFGYESLVLGFGIGAAAAIPGNCLQGIAGVIIAVPLYLQLRKIPALHTAQ